MIGEDFIMNVPVPFITLRPERNDPHPLIKGAGVLEVVADHATNTYRGVYTVKFKGAVYVLHAFQKKSKSGRKTPLSDMDLIKRRLASAKEHYESWIQTEEASDQGGSGDT
jgi:phage-related protein